MKKSVFFTEGKVSVDTSQERLSHIQKLREAIKEEEARLKTASSDSEQPGNQTNQVHTSQEHHQHVQEAANA